MMTNQYNRENKTGKRMETNIYKQIELENKHTLFIQDMSRKISEDAFMVLMKAVIEIEIKKDLFSGQDITDTKFNDIISLLGDKVVYEYAIERNFILAADKDVVFKGLFDTFMGNLGQYIVKPQFPGKVVLRKYKEKAKHRERY